MSSVVTKVWAGSSHRKSRFHDETGALVPFGRAARNFPRAITSKFAATFTGGRFNRPWLSYDGLSYALGSIRKNSLCVEYGSGQSTAFWARKFERVISVESNPEWFNKVRDMLATARITNVDLHLEHEVQRYTSAADFREADLILVDGIFRKECVEENWDRLSPGGIMYLDNSDKTIDMSGSDVRAAATFLDKKAIEGQARVQRFVDFAPATLFAQQCLVAQRI